MIDPSSEGCEELWAPWMSPPMTELGCALPLRVVLVRDDALVIALNRFVVYRIGFLFTLTIRHRGPLAAVIDSLDPFFVRPLGEGRAGGQLRLGVRFSDGREATTERPWWNPPDLRELPPWPVMHGAGGFGGSPRRWDADLWVWPLPPEGALIFSCAWPSLGVAPTALEVDATSIRAARGRVDVLWAGEGQ
jgi:hypothetical protein